jgi:acetyltransferase-like isoleucine patch superfamily enzyme
MVLGKYVSKLFLGLFSHLPSSLKISFYRLLGAKIGNNVELGFGSFILTTSFDFKKIEIGNHVKIDDDVRILAQRLSLGEGSQIRDNTKIWGQSVFTMGKKAYIDQDCFFDLRNDITLGNSTGVGGGSWLYTHGVFHSVLEGTPYRFGPIIIGDRTWVAANVFIMPGITIGSDVLVESRSVVTRDVQYGMVVAGHPAREITKMSKITRNLSIKDKQWILRNVLIDFVRVHSDNAILIKDTKEEMVIHYDARAILFSMSIESKMHDAGICFAGTRSIIIAFMIPAEIRENFDKTGIIWFDLGNNQRSGALDPLALILARFFENFGIGLDTEGR